MRRVAARGRDWSNAEERVEVLAGAQSQLAPELGFVRAVLADGVGAVALGEVGLDDEPLDALSQRVDPCGHPGGIQSLVRSSGQKQFMRPLLEPAQRSSCSGSRIGASHASGQSVSSSAAKIAKSSGIGNAPNRCVLVRPYSCTSTRTCAQG